MTGKKTAGYGQWASPVTLEMITAQGTGVGGLREFLDGVVWIEVRPNEGGRSVIVYRDSKDNQSDLIPPPYNVRTRVHEYGGGAWLARGDTIYFSNFSDQQLYAVRPGTEPVQVTQEAHLRFANGCVDERHQRIVYVIEDHSLPDQEPANYLGAVSLETGKVTVLSKGHDFYSSPVLSPDGSRLAWITWDHPDMPWDETILWQAMVGKDGNLESTQMIAGGKAVSIQQPRFNAAGILHFISDESGWWNIYRCSASANASDSDSTGTSTNLCPMEAEFGGPQWTFGETSYQFTDDNRILCTYSQRSEDTMAFLENGVATTIPLPYSNIGDLRLSVHTVHFTGSTANRFPELVAFDLDTSESTLVKSSGELNVDVKYISEPEAISFPTAGGATAHGFFYAPTNGDYVARPDEKPPLLVILHGGPTAETRASLSLRNQYWTSRGFALLDVNYRGSTGYGRAYRDLLRGNWGVVDVEDCVAGVRYLVEKSLVDPEKLAIRGGSAGGYTTLAALAFTDVFKAGASHYGIGDLEALAKDTHKFEARYLDSMIGRYPEDIDIYHARSPIHHVEKLTGATIFFQGLEDKVVPPNQAQTMVQALTDKGIPVAYVPFEGEQHGFRKAENIQRSLELELYFYGRIFGFSPADHIEPIRIINLD